jgi:hypothetical protein
LVLRNPLDTKIDPVPGTAMGNIFSDQNPVPEKKTVGVHTVKKPAPKRVTIEIYTGSKKTKEEFIIPEAKQ